MELIKVQSQKLELRRCQTWERCYVDHLSSVRKSDLAKTPVAGHLINHSRYLHDYQMDGCYLSCAICPVPTGVSWNESAEQVEIQREELPGMSSACQSSTLLALSWDSREAPNSGAFPQSIFTQQSGACHAQPRPFPMAFEVCNPHHFSLTHSFIMAWSGQSPVLWTTRLFLLQALCPYCYSFSLEDFQEPSHGSLCHCLQVSAQLSTLRGSILAPSLEEQFLCMLHFALDPLSPCSSSFLFIAVFFTNHYILSHFYVDCLLSY